MSCKKPRWQMCTSSAASTLHLAVLLLTLDSHMILQASALRIPHSRLCDFVVSSSHVCGGVNGKVFTFY